jgi:hypothetical protein
MTYDTEGHYDTGGHSTPELALFENISGQTLAWERATPGGSDPANLFQNPSQQILTCRPDSSFSVPVTCGDDSPPERYIITTVPEPGTFWLVALGSLGLVGLTRRRRLAG